MMTVTWDQAAIMDCWSGEAFQALGISRITIRKWASIGLIHPVAKGPNGAHLYQRAAVVKVRAQVPEKGRTW